MIEVIKENNEIELKEELTPQQEDAHRLFHILELLGSSEEDLNSKINEEIGNYVFQTFEMTDFLVFEIYAEKKAWYQLRAWEDDSPKVFHAIVEIKNENKTVSIGYNPGQGSLSFKLNDGALKFYKLRRNKNSDAPLVNEFAIVLKRLLK